MEKGIEIYTDHGGNELEYDELLPCPFCGGSATLMFKGNNYTKSRSATVTCNSCYVSRTIGAVHHDAIWCAKLSIDRWNERQNKND